MYRSFFISSLPSSWCLRAPSTPWPQSECLPYLSTCEYCRRATFKIMPTMIQWNEGLKSSEQFPYLERSIVQFTPFQIRKVLSIAKIFILIVPTMVWLIAHNLCEVNAPLGPMQGEVQFLGLLIFVLNSCLAGGLISWWHMGTTPMPCMASTTHTFR